MKPVEEKWNRNFSQKEVQDNPCALLTENQHLLPSSARALDFASGLGGNAVRLAILGLTTEAWDISTVAIDKLNAFAETQQLPLAGHKIDLENDSFPNKQFNVITVAHYLDRKLCSSLCDLLAPGGLLFYQTFTALKVKPGGPSNPDFLLKEGELLRLFQGLSTVFYREEQDCGNLDLGHRNLAFYIGRKPSAR